MTEESKNYEIVGFRVFVNYRQPFDVKVGAVGCRLRLHEGMNPDINEKNFPISVSNYDEVIDAFVLRYKQRISDEEVLKDMENEEIIPFDFPKLLDFAICFKDLPEAIGKDSPRATFLALGATRHNVADGGFITPFFMIDSKGDRRLDVLEELEACNPDWAFLGFRK